MTLILSWVSRNSKKISSVYIAADSRISKGKDHWDSAKKVFTAKTQPLIFGYCGDVLIPSTLLAALVDSIDGGLLFRESEPPNEKWNKIREFLRSGLKNSRPFLSTKPSEVYALSRTGTENFFAAHFRIDGENIELDGREILAEKTKGLKVMGSGSEYFSQVFSETKTENDGDYSRIYFASFCKAVASGAVPTIGGPPQLAVLRTSGAGAILPIKFNGVLWHQGVRTEVGCFKGEAFDEKFQRINPKTLDLVKGAQRQPLKEEYKKKTVGRDLRPHLSTNVVECSDS